MEGSKTQYADNTASAGLIVRQKEPKNLEAPFDRIDSYLTPTELFYIRNHSPAPIPYTWSVPRAKSLQPEVLIAYQMNGRDLPRDHGFPVRAIVPGHYGMASVKWLTDIRAVREPFHGYWQTSDYAYWASMDGKLVRRALGEMQLKSQIARPRV